jgi:hypothetical protein
VSRLGGGEQGLAITRVEHQMTDDVAEKVRAIDPPVFACRIAVIKPRALARGHQQQHLTLLCRAGSAMVSVLGIRILGHHRFSFSLSLVLPVLVAPGTCLADLMSSRKVPA